ncbi:MAG TPA: hypothetical protein VGL93_10555 [Streptosporangiaceae bacterium]|jgi:hypothetical protein
MLDVNEFMALLGGLSAESRFAQAYEHAEVVVDDPGQVARALHSS